MEAKRIVITGASRGIGRETALALAASGWAVGLVSRGGDELKEVAAECERSAPSVIAVAADLTQPTGVSAVTDAVSRDWGALDVLLNNAGVFHESTLAELSADDLDEAWAINARASIMLTKALLGDLERSRGHVINIGSRSAVRGLPEEVAFCATKAAVAGFSAALRAEMKESGVRVSCVHPGPVNTWGASDSEADGLLAPQEVAEFLRFVAESRAEFYDVRFGLPE